jgi:aspartyl-tRNA synthetase
VRQLDMEMSFADEATVMNEIEKLLHRLWHKLLGQNISLPIPRMTYQEAMSSYGVDKPDLRYESKV